jgi:hypothetical protein
MGNNIAWSDEETHTLFGLRRQGVKFSEIGKRLGRSKKGCEAKFYRLYKERAPRKYSRPKYSMCWICQKAATSCRKPVKGWKATKIVNHEYESYIVKQCPKYEPEPWVDKYDCSEFFRNPKKAVKNGKTSRSKT